MKWFIVFMYVLNGQSGAVVNDVTGYPSEAACWKHVAYIQATINTQGFRMFCAGNDAVAKVVFPESH
jgi:hypothetical protein